MGMVVVAEPCAVLGVAAVQTNKQNVPRIENDGEVKAQRVAGPLLPYCDAIVCGWDAVWFACLESPMV